MGDGYKTKVIDRLDYIAPSEPDEEFLLADSTTQTCTLTAYNNKTGLTLQCDGDLFVQFTGTAIDTNCPVLEKGKHEFMWKPDKMIYKRGGSSDVKIKLIIGKA